MLLEQFVLEENAITLYTDASKINGANSVGTACYSDSLNCSIQKSINCFASIFTAESIALNDALDISLKNKNNNVIVFSDSLSVLQKLKSLNINITSDSYIYEIKRKLIEFNSNNTSNSKIKLIWIPAHIGITGNEYVDQIAKMATKVQPRCDIRIPFSDLRQIFKANAEYNTELVIKELGLIKGCEYFKFYYNNSKKPWFNDYNLTRANIVMINRSRANHYNLAASLARVKFINDPMCTCGIDEQDLDHILWQCPMYEKQRVKLIKELRQKNIFLPIRIRSMLADIKHSICKILYEFFKTCNLEI